MALTYSEYLKVDELLELQQPLSTDLEHDETLFIIIHQVYELWFKQILHECSLLDRLLQNQDLSHGHHTLKRVLKILKTMVSQVDVLETMTPLEFESFRSYLDTSSGFQSYQFRELEFLLGYKRERFLNFFAEDSIGRAKLEKRLSEPSIWARFLGFLSLNGYPIPDSVLNREVTLPTESSAEVQEILIDIYRNNREIATFCEGLVDLDEGLQEWRYRHVKMVQRTIGHKRGTGNSSGVDYLKATLFTSVFPDLWEIRSRF